MIKGDVSTAKDIATRMMAAADIQEDLQGLDINNSPLVRVIEKSGLGDKTLPIKIIYESARPLKEEDFKKPKRFARKGPRQKLTEREIGWTDVLDPLHEIELCSGLRHKFKVISQEVFDGGNPIKIAKKHKWIEPDIQTAEVFFEKLNQSCLKMTKLRNDQPVIETESKKAQENITKVIKRITLNRKGWYPLGQQAKEAGYFAWPFVWALTEELKGQHNKVDTFIKILFEKQSGPINLDGTISPALNSH